MRPNHFLVALGIFSNTIIGVGLFGLPLLALNVGFWTIVLGFGVLGLVVILLHLCFAEVMINTPGSHRFPGYVKSHLSNRYVYLAYFSTGVGLVGGMIAYLLIGGRFLSAFLSYRMPINSIQGSFLFLIFGAALIYVGGRALARVELGALAIFGIILGWFSVKAWPLIEVVNLSGLSLNKFFIPFGVIIFSLWGMSSLPEARERLNGSPDKLRKLIIIGVLLPIAIYIAFIILTLGVSGGSVTEDALIGLKPFIGPRIMQFGFLLGLLTTFTSYIMFGLTLKKVLIRDIGINHFLSWIISVFLPIGIMLLGVSSFLVILGLVGAIGLGIDGLLILKLYKKVSNGKKVFEIIYVPKLILTTLGLFLLAGIIIELSNIILRNI